MRRIVGTISLLLMAVGLVSCLGKPQVATFPTEIRSTGQPASSPFLETTPAVLPAKPAVQAIWTPQETPTKGTPPPSIPTESLSQRPRYHLTAELDYDRHFLSVEETISYTNQSTESIPDLILLVEPSRYPGAFTLKSIHWKDGSPVSDYQRAIGSLRVPLPAPLSPGETIQISLSFEISIPSPDPSYYGKPVPFGYSDRQTNLVDWYPFLPPYLPGEGWLARPAAPFGEYLVYEASDFQVDLRLLPSGRELIVAASAPGERRGKWIHYEYPAARNIVWSVSDQYVVETLQVGQVSVRSYAFPSHQEASRSALKTSAEAVRLYSRLFGDYPRESLSLVEADFLDGMEYDGLFFLSKGFYNLYSGTPADYLTAIAAHETAHQWFYAQVGNDQALEPWLDEALATYSERLYYENLHPEALDWWWTYRVLYYEPHGWVDGSVYNPEGYRSYRDAVYLNGAVFLEDLRELVGDSAFFPFLNTYSGRFSNQISTGDKFFDLLGEFSSTDLSALFDQYFANR